MEKIRIKKRFTAAFDVDAEKCFTPLCPIELPVPDGQNIVAELNAQAELAWIRVGSKDGHSPKAYWVTENPAEVATPVDEAVKGPNIDLKWRSHGVPGTLGFELLDGLPKPIEYDYFVWKGIELDLHPYGACYHDLQRKLSTGVIEYLRSKNIIHVLLGGLAADYCEGLTGLELLDAGFIVIFNKAATRGLTVEGTEAMIEKLKANGAIIIDSVADLKLI